MKHLKLYEDFKQTGDLPKGVEKSTIYNHFEFTNNLTGFSTEEIDMLESLASLGGWKLRRKSNGKQIGISMDVGDELLFGRDVNGKYELMLGRTTEDNFPCYVANSLDELLPLAIDALKPDGIEWDKIK
jgi:hypothetical protein